jgi:hypothetical protein
VPYSEDEIGIALTWGEVSEALQSNYMAKANTDGRYSDDVLLNNSLTIIAALCREVRVNDTNGTFTELPVPKETMAFRTYAKQRMQFFKDLPCSVARDVGFFLTISYIGWYQTTITLAQSGLLTVPTSGLNAIDCVNATNIYVVLAALAALKVDNSQ